MDAQKITVWTKGTLHKKTLEYEYEHNHYENGWVENDIPQPLDPSFTLQKDWASDSKFKGIQIYVWLKQFAYLQNGKVVNRHGEGI